MPRQETCQDAYPGSRLPSGPVVRVQPGMPIVRVQPGMPAVRVQPGMPAALWVLHARGKDVPSCVRETPGQATERPHRGQYPPVLCVLVQYPELERDLSGRGILDACCACWSVLVRALQQQTGKHEPERPLTGRQCPRLEPELSVSVLVCVPGVLVCGSRSPISEVPSDAASKRRCVLGVGRAGSRRIRPHGTHRACHDMRSACRVSDRERISTGSTTSTRKTLSPSAGRGLPARGTHPSRTSTPAPRLQAWSNDLCSPPH